MSAKPAAPEGAIREEQIDAALEAFNSVPCPMNGFIVSTWDREQMKATLLAALTQGTRRCPHCDDTGDVHGIDGEWRGTCTCPAGTRQAEGAVDRSQPVGAGLTFPQKQFDELLDHIYEYGTTAEGVKRLAEKMISAALSVAASAPAGWKLVPIEPTDAMWNAAVVEQNRVEAMAPGQHPSCFQIYKAMLSASPSLPVSGVIEGDGSIRDKGDSRG